MKKKQPRHRPIDSAHPAEDEEALAVQRRQHKEMYLPDLDEIDAGLAEIRADWSDAEHYSRGTGACVRWEPPTVSGRQIATKGRCREPLSERIVDDLQGGE